MPGGRYFPGASNNGSGRGGRGFDRDDRRGGRDSRFGGPRDRRADSGEPEEAGQEEMLSRSSRDRGRRKMVKKKKARVFFHQSLTRIALPKILTKARYMSAPLAIKYVESGRVRINSRVVMSIYYEVNLRKERVTIDEVPIEFPRQLSYYVYNKPRNMLCEKGDALFDSLFTTESVWSFPFGRLTKALSGLVIVTNDPRLRSTQHMVDDQLQKEYRVRINKVLTDEQLDELRGGVLVGDDYFVPLRVSVHQTNVDSQWLDITVLDDSYHRFVRALKVLGAEIMRMRRTRIALLHENTVPLGEWREMSGHEVSMLGIHRFMRGELPPEPPPPPRPEREARPWEKKRPWGARGGDRDRPRGERGGDGRRDDRGGDRGGDRERPRGPRPGGEERSRGERGPRPEGARGDRDRPRGERSGDSRGGGDRPRGDRPQGDRPRGDRPGGDRPRGDRPAGDRPRGDRQGGDRPRGDRPQGDRPQGDRPRGDRPQGDRPRGDGRRDEGRRDDRGGDRPRGDRGEERRGDRRDEGRAPRPDAQRPDRSEAPRDTRRDAERETMPESPRPIQSERPAAREVEPRPERNREEVESPRASRPETPAIPPTDIPVKAEPARRSRRGTKPEPPAES